MIIKKACSKMLMKSLNQLLKEAMDFQVKLIYLELNTGFDDTTRTSRFKT